MQRSALILVMALLAQLLFTACSTLPINGKLPDGLAAEKIVTVDSWSPFALAPDVNVLAMASKGLKLFHLPSKENVPLDDRAPVKLSWSPQGYFLAAIYAKDGTSSIAIYDQHGTVIAETPFTAALTSLGWRSENEVVAGGVKVTSYKFGSNYQSLYVSWQPGRSMPAENSLRDTTLQPVTVAQWKPLLERGPMLDTTLQSGALLYLHPIDPPLFTPYYKLILKDLASGKELEIASAGLTSSGGRFSADGEVILYPDGNGSILLYNPWTEELLRKVSSSGKNPAFSPDGANWIADGALFRKDGTVTPLAEGAEARFSNDGSRVVLREGGEIYLLTGLKPAGGTLFVPAVAEKVAKLRSLRIQGLVTPQEYKDSLQKITAP